MMAAEYLSTAFQLLLIDMEKQNLNYIRKKRRDSFLAAISREDLDITALHKYTISEGTSRLVDSVNLAEYSAVYS